MSNRLIVADLHLEDSPLAEYRWEIFNQLKNIAMSENVSYIDILGDLTEKKDKHSSILVNRIVSELVELSHIADVRILKGNHDFIEKEEPFFRFLMEVEGITYVSIPKEFGDTLFLPNSTDLYNYLQEHKIGKNIKYIYLHHSFFGASTQNGYEMKKGYDYKIFDNYNQFIYSGDIHVPQEIGNVIYVGSPYQIYFGDNYTGRILLLKNDEEIEYETSSFFPERHKLFITSGTVKTMMDGVKKNDQVKVVVELDKTEYHEWENIKKDIKKQCDTFGVILVSLEMKPIKNNVKLEETGGIKIKSLSAKEIVDKFAKKENLDAEFVNAAYGVINE